MNPLSIAQQQAQTNTSLIPHTTRAGSFLRIYKPDVDLYEDVLIEPGQEVLITVPHEKIHEFLCSEYILDFQNYSEWDAKDKFLETAWKEAKKIIQPYEQESFDRDYEIFKRNATEITTKQYRLSDMYKNGYPQDSIDQLVMDIDLDYSYMIRDASENFFTRRYVYGTHFKLSPKPIVVKREKIEVFTMDEEPYMKVA